MKKTTSTPIFLPLVICLTLLLGSCASSLTYEDAMSRNRKNISSMARLEDANFLVEAASYNILEQKVLELALERGYSAAVVNHARQNTEEYEEMGDDLNKLARKKDIKVAGQLKAEHQAILDRLAGAGRSDFDQEFVEALDDIIDDNTDLYEDQASAADDADIRAFAARSLTLLRDHAEAIENVDDQLMSTKR